jgi:hypothetical protein
MAAGASTNGRDSGAYHLRETTGTSGLELTLRSADKTDVIELIKALRLPRELVVDEVVRPHYLETWDALAREKDQGRRI